MNVFEYAKVLLCEGGLPSKLLSSNVVTDWSVPSNYNNCEYQSPGREISIETSQKQIRFPKKTSFHLEEKRAMAMHFFANHELLAIEMMAASILKFPVVGSEGERFRKLLVSTIEDEQKHLKLYISRMEEMSLSFGDLPLNDFFWKQMKNINSLEEYFALMSLTFEAANLDFACFYSKVFKEVEDEKSTRIMDIVLKDEISHVAVGANWLKKACEDQDLFSYYQSLLPEKITPARAKGLNFEFTPRQQAGLDINFVNSMKDYRDDFNVTDRREWKQ